MSYLRPYVLPSLSRRRVLQGLALTPTVWALPVKADQTEIPRPIAPPESKPAPAPAKPATQTNKSPFSFNALAEKMKKKAGEPYQEPEKLSGFAKQLDYDLYRQVNFRPDRARWLNTDSSFRVQAFHPGWLYNNPVHLYEIVDGQAHRMTFSSDDFEYTGDAAKVVQPHDPLPGVAGFRLHYPLNKPNIYDEVIAFQGASYFRAVGRGNVYGCSARGLAINTAGASDEEFPLFTTFYLERPSAGTQEVNVYAELDSPSVTGAYHFVVRPGETTGVDVTAQLYFRADVEWLGVAPLTSMFLFAENNRSKFDDFRSQVHDSDGLHIERSSGEVLWRSLNNPPRLAKSFFVEKDPRNFGLRQRDRKFANYQDAGAHYEKRPSVDVLPAVGWGDGKITLIEIPSDRESNDNIVSFWLPDQQAKAGEERAYAYQMVWGDLSPDDNEDLAYVLKTRTGTGGVAGEQSTDGKRKFVVDFRGGMLGKLRNNADVKADITVTHGKMLGHTLSKISDTDIWRMVIDAIPDGDAAMELVGSVSGYNRRLTETWLYQWMDDA